MSQQFTVIHANVHEPGRGLFKAKASDRAECQTIECCNPSCPLLAVGQCHMRGGLFGNPCPYGKAHVETGPTKKSKGFYSWTKERREKYAGVRYLLHPSTKMAFIGEYVLLPYAHMDMCEAVPFLRHSVFFGNGIPFIPRDKWTLDCVLKLLAFRPQAMMGGEIRSYQNESIPKFIEHLREVDPAMWSQLIAVRPELDKPANYVGRSAFLRTLRFPLEWTETVRPEYPVTWKWDGKVLITDSKHLFSETWGKVKIDSVVIHATPNPDATVVVQSNDWVTSETVFVD